MAKIEIKNQDYYHGELGTYITGICDYTINYDILTNNVIKITTIQIYNNHSLSYTENYQTKYYEFLAGSWVFGGRIQLLQNGIVLDTLNISGKSTSINAGDRTLNFNVQETFSINPDNGTNYTLKIISQVGSSYFGAGHSAGTHFTKIKSDTSSSNITLNQKNTGSASGDPDYITFQSNAINTGFYLAFDFVYPYNNDTTKLLLLGIRMLGRPFWSDTKVFITSSNASFTIGSTTISLGTGLFCWPGGTSSNTSNYLYAVRTNDVYSIDTTATATVQNKEFLIDDTQNSIPFIRGPIQLSFGSNSSYNGTYFTGTETYQYIIRDGGGSSGGGDEPVEPSIVLSTIGKQNTIISENNSKKDFSSLYEDLQNMMEQRANCNDATEVKHKSTLFARNIKALWESNKNKYFNQNSVITQTTADSTINIVAKFADLSNFNDYSIINAINASHNIVRKLKADDPANPYYCKGVCVGFCTVTCDGACTRTCSATNTTNSGTGEQEPRGCRSSCSTNCALTCGWGCKGTCDGSSDQKIPQSGS